MATNENKTSSLTVIITTLITALTTIIVTLISTGYFKTPPKSEQSNNKKDTTTTVSTANLEGGKKTVASNIIKLRPSVINQPGYRLTKENATGLARHHPSTNILEKQAGVPQNLELSKGYVSTNMKSSVSFDYSNENGYYTIGEGQYSFKTKWSSASSTAIHTYNDNISGVALATDATNMSDVNDPAKYDFSSRTRDAGVGSIVVFKNAFGNYALAQITKILCASHGDSKDQLDFNYVILKRQ